MRVRLVGLAAAVVSVSLAVTGCSSSPAVTTAPLQAPLPTEAPAPDAIFPGSGDTAYDVERYDVDLAYDPATGTISARALLHAVAAQPLSGLSVDLGEMQVDAVDVDGVPARAVEHRVDKLRLLPATPIAEGAPFVLGVTYHGVPEVRADPSLGAPIGWIRTTTGSYTALEPNGAATWLPTNDRPGDKAVYHLRLTVPEPYRAVANGVLAAEEPGPGILTTTWDMPEPMAPSELQVTVGRLGRVDSTSPKGLPLTSFVVAGAPDPTASLALVGEMADFYGSLFGPYPFAAAGLTATDGPAGLAVDAQARPLVAAADLQAPVSARSHGVLAAAMAHQWFGAAVTPARWQDIWLSEGFARYARWLWMDEVGLQPVDDAAANALARTNEMRAAFGPPDQPSADTLLSPSVVDGGAVALHALRQTVGDTVFFTILRRWVQRYAGESVTTDQFVDHASEIAGEDLTGLFDLWLSGSEVPAAYPSGASP